MVRELFFKQHTKQSYDGHSIDRTGYLQVFFAGRKE